MSVGNVVEVTAGSPTSFEEAAQNGITKAAATLRNIQGAWVEAQKVKVEAGLITEYRVMLRVTTFLFE